jgi:hypothetical protein
LSNKFIEQIDILFIISIHSSSLKEYYLRLEYSIDFFNFYLAFIIKAYFKIVFSSNLQLDYFLNDAKILVLTIYS